MSALQNCCITVKAPEYGGMDNGGLPTVQGDWNQDYREALMAISRYFDRLALGMEPGAPGEHSVLFQKGSTAAAPAPATGTITMATSSGVARSSPSLGLSRTRTARCFSPPPSTPTPR